MPFFVQPNKKPASSQAITLYIPHICRIMTYQITPLTRITMKETNPEVAKFFADIKPHQQVWALQDHSGEEWVVCDSVNFENTDAMPFWSTKELAQAHCSEEWKSYQPAAISVSDLLEFWIEDLNSDNVIAGLNWNSEGECPELELADFTQAIVDIEAL